MHIYMKLSIQGDSEISLEKKPVIGNNEKRLYKKKILFYKSFFVFEIQIIVNLVKIASTYAADLKVIT
jgi:hypothetical protein